MQRLTRRSLAAGLTAAAMLQGVRHALAQTPGPATRNLPKTYAGTTLKLLWGPEPVNVAIAQFSREFTEQTGIQLDYTQVNYGDRYQKMVLDVASKTNAFDVYLNAYQWKEELAPYVIDHANIEHEIPGSPPLEPEDFPKRALDIYTRAGGKMMAIPIAGSATFLVWNRKAYQEAGLDPDHPPADWQGVYDNGLKLRGGKQFGLNMPAGKSIQTACVWITLLHGYGGGFTDAKGQPTFDSAAALRATRMMSEQLMQVSPPGNLTWDFPEMVNSFAVGQAAQGFMWPGGFSTLLDPAKSVNATSLGWAPTPEAVMLGGWAVSVNANARGRDAAKLYVAWLTSREISRRLALITAQPCRISAFEAPEVVAKFPHLPAVLQGMSGKVAAYMPIRDSEQVNIIIYDEVNAACARTKTPEDAVASMQDKVTVFMKRRGYLRG